MDDPATAHAAAALAELDAGRAALLDRVARRPWRHHLLWGVLLGAGIAVGALHNAVVSVVALPMVLAAFAALTGVDDWRRAGVHPRRPRGARLVALTLALLVPMPLIWGGAAWLDAHGHRWALVIAGVVLPCLVTAIRVWIERSWRHEVMGR